MSLLIVRHLTRYRYREPVRLGEHRLMFRPRDSFDQHLLDYRLSISPQPSQIRWIHDLFGRNRWSKRGLSDATGLGDKAVTQPSRGHSHRYLIRTRRCDPGNLWIITDIWNCGRRYQAPRSYGTSHLACRRSTLCACHTALAAAEAR
jgi:hypothetical protein